MPTSEHWQIPWVVEVIAREQPKTVLDVGAGYGKYGILVREYASPERVDAVDVTPPRFEAYDNVYLGDARELDRLLPAEVPTYDLALFLDIIEHLEKADAWPLLETLTRRARRVLITTPLGFRAQEIPGLPYETHRSGWFPWEFDKRFQVHRSGIFPGHLTKHLRLPRLWQMLVLIGRKG